MKTTGLMLLAGTLVLSIQAANAWWYGPPGGPPSYDRYGAPPPRYTRSPSIDVSTRKAGDTYVVTISLNGYVPEDLEVAHAGRWLLSQRARSAQDSAQEPGAYSYQHSYSTVSRRITLPRDADVSRMERADSEGMIRLTIPRLYR